MDVNDDAYNLDERAVLWFIASRLAPTVKRSRLMAYGYAGFR
ncbi:hypothetical protein C8K63_101562 [Pseudomonas sp. GV085]|nr:hypothetical protein C8K63_101562 [Pseudomonas sp. GV085]